MNVKVSGNGVSGSVCAIPSKSDVHRALICASLADRKSRVNFSSFSQDIEATISCLRALGAKINTDSMGAEIEPIGEKFNIGATLDCFESGSTIRFMIPVAAALGAEASFTGRGRLAQRPLEPLSTLLENNGCSFSEFGIFPLKVSGKLQGNDFSIKGDVSSQFITGLLFALPLIGGGKITVIEPVESKKYIDMTVRTMRQFGIDIIEKNNVYSVSGKYTVLSDIYISDGDWSNAAFFLSAGAINGEVTVTDIYKNSLQGDKEIVDILKSFGATVSQNDSSVTVKADSLKGIDIDASQIPDLVPILSVVASFAKGETKIYNAGRLRIKESDRLSAVSKMINSLGGKVTELADSLIISGNPNLKCSGVTDSFNDHRMVMSASILAVCSKTQITINNAQAVNKSYPDFFKDLALLGGKTDVL